MKRILCCLKVAAFIIAINVNAQKQELATVLIPENLREDTNAVIRNTSVDIEVFDVDKMVIKEKRIITILNKLGNRNLRAGVGYDNNSKIVKLSAKIYDANGKELKKYSKNKFLDVSAVDGATLYSDSRIKYLDYTPTNYPYTVVFEYEKHTSSTGFVPNWNPIESYFVSIENSSYSLKTKKNLEVRFKEKNFKGFDITNTTSSTNLFYSLTNQKALNYERSSPSINTFRPKALVALNNFKTDGVKGFYTNWNEFGKWMNNNLLSGRNMLNESTKSEILSLTKEAEDDVEKAKIVYQYVQDKTRYISVQVGIGGIQPIAANEVDQVSYGDCKGLTNYTKALLDVVGVTSYYTHVEAGRNKVSFEKDFASLEQGNHVILNIPNKGNDVWLECTSQTVPFGFLGDFTDDRDVLVMTPEGGIMKRTPKYVNEDNLQTITAKIKLTDVGNAIAKLERKSYGIQYDGKYLFKNKSIEDLKKHYKSSTWDYNNNLEVTAVNLDNNKDKIEFTEVVDITINEYATKQDSSFIFKVNVFNRLTNIPKRYRKRDKPFTIDRGFVDRDELVVELPEGYSLESLPENKELKTKYGMYKVSFEKLNATTIKYKREVFLKDGIYPKEDYKSYRKFRKSIAKYDNLRIALTKK